MKQIERLERRSKPSRFEIAYIQYYNGRITIDSFLETCGIEDKEKAWSTLKDYRRRVVSGEIQDPRETYKRWR